MEVLLQYCVKLVVGTNFQAAVSLAERLLGQVAAPGLRQPNRMKYRQLH